MVSGSPERADDGERLAKVVEHQDFLSHGGKAYHYLLNSSLELNLGRQNSIEEQN